MSTGSKKTQAQLKQREKMKEEQRLADFRAMLGTPAGRRFFYWLVSRKCELFSVLLSNDSADAFRNQGQRMVGGELWAEAQSICPTECVTMLAEATETNRQDEIYRKAALEAANRDDEGE